MINYKNWFCFLKIKFGSPFLKDEESPYEEES